MLEMDRKCGCVASAAQIQNENEGIKAVKKPFIVAEVGASHLGDLDRAIALIDAAARTGADAVKFQCWKDGTMALGDYTIEGTAWAGERMRDLYRDAYTPWEWFPRLFDYAKRVGIECFASVFDHESLAFLESLDCPRYKIASFEIVDLPLIEAVAKTGKPMIISTGMASKEESFEAVDLAFESATDSITVLKCTSAYPAPMTSVNLRTLSAMLAAPRFHDVGISDHTLGLAVPVAATALGATMIEKHLTLRRADGGPDAAFSSEPWEFKAMVSACREAALAIGEVRYGPTEAELPSLQFRRSLYWAKDIRQGETITREHFRTARPALGLPPKAMYELIGTTAKYDAKKHAPVR